jgi:hypothetical protein
MISDDEVINLKYNDDYLNVLMTNIEIMLNFATSEATIEKNMWICHTRLEMTS